MGKETILFKSEEKMSRSSLADLLRQFAKKIDEGKVVLQQGKKEVTLKIPAKVELEVKAEKEVGRRKSKKKLELEIEWVLGGEKEERPFSLG